MNTQAFGSDTALEAESNIDTLCRNVLPLWAKQVDAVREQTEEAAVALTGRFALLVERLEAACSAC